MRFLLLCLLFFISKVSFSQVGIGTDNPSSSAALDIVSSDKGLIVPRMDTAMRNAITSPATGLLIYDTTLNNFCYYNGTVWVCLETNESEDVGMITSFETSSVPSGWLVLDGSAVLVSNYPSLASIYPSWVSGAMINLPDYRGLHMRGSGINADGVTGGILEATNDYTTAIPSGGFTTNTTGSHSHTANNTNSVSHNHFYLDYSSGVANSVESSNFSVFDNAFGTSRFTGTAGSHNHSFTLSTDGSHKHISVTGGDPITNPHYISVVWAVKAL